MRSHRKASNVVALFPTEQPKAKALEAANEKQLKAAESFAKFAEPAMTRKPRAFKGKSKKGIEGARVGALEMCATAEWGGATGDHLVALYGILHEKVYGVAPVELDAKVWCLAAAAANRMLKEHFSDDPARAVPFMRWAWRREYEREQWRRANNRSGQRLSWRLQFSASLVTDYRVDHARTQSAAQ